jgi:hypothetical protein
MLIVTSTTVAAKEEESDSDEEQEDVKQPARQLSPMPVIAEESCWSIIVNPNTTKSHMTMTLISESPYM